MTKNLRAAFFMALLAIGCLLTNAPAHAQAVYGSIFGTVTDKTGAVVPGATVTVTDEAKGTVETVVSNGSGDYSVTHLVPDTYDLKVDLKGFKSFLSKGIQVAADTAPRVDVALEISGGGSETVEVNADSVPQLKADRADVSTVFDSQQVADLPIGDQNFTNLQLLLPGAQLLGWSHAADENPQGSRQIQVDGQAFGGTAFELDGTDNQDPILGIIVINPAIDAVTETKITTQNFDAELGKAVSAVVTAQTKSGSNTFHGSAYDFRTGNANLARDPFSQPPGPNAIPPGLKNRYGGSIGGRAIRDRLFFFGNYEAQRQKVGTSVTDTLPSKLLVDSCLNGGGCNFSEYLANLPHDKNGVSQGAIYDTTKPYIGTDGKTHYEPFPGNIIPSDRLSQQALGLFKLLQPYSDSLAGSGSEGGLNGNFNASGTGLFNSDAWTVRGDATLSQKANAFARFSRFTDTLSGTVAFGSAGGPGFGIGGYGGNSKGANDSLAAGADYVFNPTLVADLRLGYYRYNVIDSKFDQGTEFANQLGIPGINFGDNFTSGSPGFAFATLSGGNTQPLYGAGLNINRCNCPLTEREDQFQIVNNWTKTWGNHAFKVGADLRYGRNLRVPSDTDRAGLLTFNNGPTSDPAADTQGGIGFASFLLGDVTNFGRYVSTSTNAKEFQKRTFFYVQDTWRASSKLTLNLGVRWELYFPETVNGKGNGSLLNLKDGYLHVAGYGGIGSNLGWTIDKAKQLEPRIGIAYQLNAKTVVRTGYGRSFDTGVFGSIFGHTVTQNLPVLANQSLNNATNIGQSFCLGSPADNPGCNPGNSVPGQPVTTGGPLPYTPVSVPSNGLLPNPGNQVTSKARQNPLTFPTLDAWNLSFQRALTPVLSLTIAYVGNKGTHTLSSGDGNSTNPNEAAIVLPGSSTAFGQTISSVNGQTLHYDPKVNSDPSKGPIVAADGGTSTTNLLQRYYGASLPACQDPNYVSPTSEPLVQPGQCGWTSGIQFNGDDQNTSYNAMQVTLTQQQWKGLNMTANYAWQSAFNHGGTYSTWDKTVAYGRDDFVRANVFNAYGSYQLPFGKGKMFLTGANRVTDLIIGGYQLSGTLNWSSGLPYTLSINCGQDIPSSAPCYPNVIPGGHLKTSLSAFDPGSRTRTFYQQQDLSGGGLFSDPGLDHIGNSGRNTYYGPTYYNTDLSLEKKFQIYESLLAQFRFDAYNAVNHINPGNPGGNITSAGTINGEAPGPGPRALEFSFRLQF
jgi:hypothetical protein